MTPSKASAEEWQAKWEELRRAVATCAPSQPKLLCGTCVCGREYTADMAFSNQNTILEYVRFQMDRLEATADSKKVPREEKAE